MNEVLLLGCFVFVGGLSFVQDVRRGIGVINLFPYWVCLWGYWWLVYHDWLLNNLG